MFIREPAYAEQLTRWGLDSLPGAMAFPAQLGPPPAMPDWRRVAEGSTDACYRLAPGHGEPPWLFQVLYLKQRRHDPPAWRYLLRRSRAAREASNLARLASLGIYCPRVVAVGELRQSAGALTKVFFALSGLVLAAGLLAAGLGWFIRWLAGSQFGPALSRGLVQSGLTAALWAGGAMLGAAAVVGLLRCLRRDYFVGSVVLVTGIEPSDDLWRFARLRWRDRPPGASPYFVQNAQVRRLARELAAQLAVVHRSRFVHGDLKFRNLLVCWPRDQQPGPDNLRLAWIDCPRGRRLPPGPWLDRRRIKDLANLDRNAAPFLSRTQRLRFLTDYLFAFGGQRAVRRARSVVRKIARYNRRRRPSDPDEP